MDVEIIPDTVADAVCAVQSLAPERLAGDRIELSAGGLTLSGRVAGDAIEGRVADGGAAGGTWTAQRVR